MFKLISEDSSNPRTRATGVGFTSLISGLLLLAVVCAPVALAKGKPDPGGPGLQLIINEVFLTDPFDLDDVADNQLMDIFGADFDPGDDPLVVTLGVWDLTDDCSLSPDFDHISCVLPQGGVGVAGDYLLKVSHGLGQSEGDEYDLTIAEPPVPEGTIAFYAATACPPGWDEYTAARGLAIVGLPWDGSVAGTVAGVTGTAMGDMEDRTGHTHDVDPAAVVSSSAGAHSHGGATQNAQNSAGVEQFNVYPCIQINNPLGNCPDEDEVRLVADTFHSHDIDEDGNHTHSVDVGNTTSRAPSKEDVLPYIQLLACVKGCISDCDAE